MDVREIRQRFSSKDYEARPVPCRASALLAGWMAENMLTLRPDDLTILLSVGGALHSMEAEQAWRESWT
ncbi:MAG: hypothetical protein ACRYHA_26930 [Janthinobacterium lividum]